MNSPIPPATAAKIATPFPPGTRHKAKLDIAIPLLANGLPDSAVFHTLRDKFPQATDHEIRAVIDWVKRQPFTPTASISRPWSPAPLNSPLPQRTPEEQADWWTNSETATVDGVVESSPISIPNDPAGCAALAFRTLYAEQDCINIVCKYILEGDKARPCGSGKTMNRDGWFEYFRSHGVPQSEAGAWMRLNPCSPKATGKDGAVTDADVVSLLFVLLEFDSLPIAKQLALLTRWKLPLAVMILSGGVSVHGWVRIAAKDAMQYKELVDRLFLLLKPFGLDQSNRNPSRLCRLPGAVRKIGAVDGGAQRLLWLNSDTEPLTCEWLKRFEYSLQSPFVNGKPLLSIAQDAITRYEYMQANAGKLGVPSGIPELDSISGGLKPGQTIVVAGETGGGKTTLGMHLVTAALNAGYGVLLYSLEMDREEIFDLMVANYCNIDRNKFNNGRFNEQDLHGMAAGMPKLSLLPLYIEDSALSDSEQIHARVMQLKADGKIGLVVVDYIQFVNPGLSRDNREQQVAQISHHLRATAREAKVPMVVLSQLNEEGKLRESRVISHNANIVMVVQVSGDDVVVTVTKGRGIPTGEYRMTFNRIHARLIPNPLTIRKESTQPRAYIDQ